MGLILRKPALTSREADPELGVRIPSWYAVITKLYLRQGTKGAYWIDQVRWVNFERGQIIQRITVEGTGMRARIIFHVVAVLVLLAAIVEA